MTSPATDNATSSTTSYASAAAALGKTSAAPLIATGSSASTSAPANASASYARPASVSPLNGSAAGSSTNPNTTNRTMSGSVAPSTGATAAKNSGNKAVTPAVPTVLNGSSGIAADHARKSSVTISATGPSSFIANGGAAPKAPLPKFGYDESPAIAHSTPSHSMIGNQRVPSPAQSPIPIPIPQPSASGGRPPPTISQDGSTMKFGSFGGDGDRHLKHNVYNSPGGIPVGSPSPHPIHSDMGNHAGSHNQGNHGHHGGPSGRGGFHPSGGRGGRGYNNNTHYNNQAMPFQPGNGPYPRGPASQGRGGIAPPFQPRGVMQQPGYGPNSPQAAAARISPAIPPAMPNNGTPQMQAAIPVAGGSPYMQMQYANAPGYPPHHNVNSSLFPNHFQDQQHFNPDKGDQQGQAPNYRGPFRRKGGRGGGGGERQFSHPPRTFDSSTKCSGPLSLPQHQFQQFQQKQQQQSNQPQQDYNTKGKPRRNSKRWQPDSELAKEPVELAQPLQLKGPLIVSSDSAAAMEVSGPSHGQPLQSKLSREASHAQYRDSVIHKLPQQGPVPPRLRITTPFGSSVTKMGPANDLSPASGNYERLLTTKQQNYPPQQYHNPQQQYQPMQQPQQGMANMGFSGYNQMNPYMQPTPQNHGFQHAFVPGQPYGMLGAQSMSRTSSQAASERPNSSTGQVQTPGSVHASLAIPGTGPGSAQKMPSTPSQFVKPKKNAIVIKNPQGETIDFNKIAPASPGPNAPASSATPPATVSATPPPPPKAATPSQHQRNESSSAGKTAEQLRNEFKEQVRKTAGTPAESEEKAAAGEKEAEAVTAAAPVAEKEKVVEPAKPIAESKEIAAPEAKKAELAPAEPDDDEIERMIREMEEEEARREAEAAAYDLKKQERDAEKKKAEEANRLASAAANDQKLREQEREMERLEEERERQRKENEAAVAKGGKVRSVAEVLAEKISDITLADRKEPAATSTDALASKMGDLKLEASSETAANKRATKPSALSLAPLNTKSAEPPQPSAALQSLTTARFLRDPTAILYPEGIQSPNPALNPAVNKKGNFKYDMSFLLQFKDVFIEKPTLDFDQQVKQLIGDGDSSSRSGTRTPGGAGSGRQNSRNNAASAFNPTGVMGSFNSKPLPAGTTSEQRFAMSSGAMPRPVATMSSFGRPGSFPGPSSMTRTPSSTIGGGLVNSPRQGSRSTRGNSRQTGHNVKSEAQAAKTMPLTQGVELKPITTSSTGWKPTSVGNRPAPGGAAGAAGAFLDPDMVQRKVKAALNKMTPEKFDKISDQILEIALQSKDEEDGRTLRQVIQLTFEKATDEAHWAGMYARFCKVMLDRMSPEIRDVTITDKKGEVISGGTLFRKYLLNRCQQEFERGWKVDLPQPKEGESRETAMLSDEYYEAAAAKRRGLGLVQFIGELYKLGMLTERIMHECVRKLVDYETTPDEAEIESLSKLLRTVGANLDNTDKGRPMMDAYFLRIKNIIDIPDLPSRLKFMLMDVVDLRNRSWVSMEANKGPKTLEEVRQEAEAAAAQKALEAQRSTSQRGVGGRPGPGGRGDTRQFSYNQPIPNQVGMDDLRRLKGSASRVASSGVPTLGPTSMFASRSNSGRRNVPGGSFGRPGDDSGPGSRTGTPPTRTDSNPVSHTNAFQALANVDSESPASPPSTAASPALAKSSLDQVSK
ncbi:hypothetical protein SEPCBS119000_002197 [Sporothrix epigloea]|uniref:MIF4G domain-containing protein n=1 Tax=Sporothrix epigloea TaxID=1892477 RepID=A0ABP0DEW7_9PEZI